MPDNRIVVDSIKNCVVLRGQEGGSVGENLSVAYAFLSTLFNRSDHVLPFVVDSPANPIDLSVRAKIGELIPSLTDQFIAFTISSERAGFIGNLSTAASGDVQYITLFRRGPVELESSAILEADHLLTDDGVRVIGKRFFESFQLETEDNVNVSTT